ncbi:MAG: hypothetical protein CM15mP83_9430 [Flavobacteriaceae bacterium]|nr:MAG: hypothetical protein CM15mP83_9430 [Flavobacteriaceae bacterium]
MNLVEIWTAKLQRTLHRVVFISSQQLRPNYRIGHAQQRICRHLAIASLQLVDGQWS